MLKKLIVPIICLCVLGGAAVGGYFWFLRDTPSGSVADKARQDKVQGKDKKPKPQAKHRPAGVYAILDSKEPVPEVLQRNPNIRGMSVTFKWNELNPEEGKMDFSRLNEILQSCANLNKRLMLTILTGPYTPQWVYAKGAQQFRYHNPLKTDLELYNKEIAIPIPWDEKYLESWTKFLEQFGKAYGKNPYLDMVVMTGPTNLTSQTSILGGNKEFDALTTAGFTQDKLVKAWGRVFSAYSRAFPESTLCLNIGLPVVGNDQNILDGIVTAAKDILGGKLAIKSAQMSDINNSQLHQPPREYSYLTKYKQGGVMIGFEQGNVGFHVSTNPSTPFGNIKSAIDYALEFEPVFFEIHHVDLSKVSDLAEQINKRLAKK